MKVRVDEVRTVSPRYTGGDLILELDIAMSPSQAAKFVYQLWEQHGDEWLNNTIEHGCEGYSLSIPQGGESE